MTTMSYVCAYTVIYGVRGNIMAFPNQQGSFRSDSCRTVPRGTMMNLSNRNFALISLTTPQVTMHKPQMPKHSFGRNVNIYPYLSLISQGIKRRATHLLRHQKSLIWGAMPNKSDISPTFKLTIYRYL